MLRSILVTMLMILFVAACGTTEELATTIDPASSRPPTRLATRVNAVRDARNRGEGIEAAKTAYADAENTANNALVNAWTHYPRDRGEELWAE